MLDCVASVTLSHLNKLWYTRALQNLSHHVFDMCSYTATTVKQELAFTEAMGSVWGFFTLITAP